MTFNPEQPYNNLPLLPPKAEVESKLILKKAISANKALAELKGVAALIPNQNILLNTLVLEEARDSSAIENVITTRDKLYEAMAIFSQKIDPATKEVLNYRKALWKGFSDVQRKGFLSTNMIIDFQAELVETNAGIRKLPGTVLQNDVTKEVIYTPPVGESNIRTLLKNFEDYLNSSNGIDPLVKMAILHYQFESIHSFYDGNGRTGRILMVLHLCLAVRLELPILFISGYINRNRKDYYRLLREITTTANWKEWILFILTAVEEQSTHTMHSVTGIRELMKKYREDINSKLPKIYSAELVEYLFSFPYYSQSSMQEKLNIASRNTASKYFSELIGIGLIKEEKYKNDKVYFCPEFHELLK